MCTSHSLVSSCKIAFRKVGKPGKVTSQKRKTNRSTVKTYCEPAIKLLRWTAKERTNIVCGGGLDIQPPLSLSVQVTKQFTEYSSTGRLEGVLDILRRAGALDEAGSWNAFARASR
jgi:hypothetical protein